MKNTFKKVANLIRVYEYVDEDGNTYWSLTKHRSTVSPPVRLVIQDRVGEHPLRFVSRFRQLVQAVRFDEVGFGDDG